MTTVQESATDNPRKLPYELIKSITNNFSQDQELGRGAFGQVFKVKL
jgi:hypothetical protein